MMTATRVGGLAAGGDAPSRSSFAAYLCWSCRLHRNLLLCQRYLLCLIHGEWGFLVLRVSIIA